MLSYIRLYQLASQRYYKGLCTVTWINPCYRSCNLSHIGIVRTGAGVQSGRQWGINWLNASNQAPRWSVWSSKYFAWWKAALKLDPNIFHLGSASEGWKSSHHWKIVISLWKLVVSLWKMVISLWKLVISLWKMVISLWNILKPLTTSGISRISTPILTKWHERLPFGIPWVAKVFTEDSHG